ncbi:MAG TPA: chaperone modulator CbpM [Burkholderiaceae bacterium]|jgi:chaperone modulatory protein CbpM|nr:chaperone modulator CbpM [Burkholderiaceae bacterium]
MTDALRLTAAVLDDDTRLEFEEFCRACGVPAEFVAALLQEELLTPVRREPTLAFPVTAVKRVRRILRLQRDFEASLPAVALILDLLDEIERLRAALRRAGLPIDA